MQGALIGLVVCISSLQGLLTYLGMTLALSAAGTVGTLFLPSSKVIADNSESVPEPSRVRTVLLAAALLYVISTLVIAGLAAWNKPWEGAAAIGTLFVGGVIYAAKQLGRGGKKQPEV